MPSRFRKLPFLVTCPPDSDQLEEGISASREACNPGTRWSQAPAVDRIFFPLKQLAGFDLRGVGPKVQI